MEQPAGVLRSANAGADGRIGVIHALDKGLLQAVVTSAVLEEHPAFVRLVARLGQYLVLLRIGHVLERGAGIGNINRAPANVVHLVVGAGIEAQHILLGRLCVGLVVDQAIPALVAQFGQHQVLLLPAHLVKGGAVAWLGHIAPGNVFDLEIHSDLETGTDLLADRCGRVVEHLLLDLGVAQLANHHCALRKVQIFKRGGGSWLGRTAPVNCIDVKFRWPIGAKTVHQFQAGGSVRVVVSRAGRNLIAQRMGHDGFLRIAQACKVGVGRWRGDCAPVDVGVAVIGGRTLAKADDRLFAGHRVVVEVVLDCRDLHVACDSLDRDGAHVVNEINNNCFLLCCQVCPFCIDIRLFNVVVQVVRRVAVPQIAGHAVVVKHIAQAVGHHHFLACIEAGEIRIGIFRRANACGGPVYLAVVVVGRNALAKAGHQLLAGWRVGFVVNRAAVVGVAAVDSCIAASHGGGKGVCGGVVVTAIRVQGVAQGIGSQINLGGAGQF